MPTIRDAIAQMEAGILYGGGPGSGPRPGQGRRSGTEAGPRKYVWDEKKRKRYKDWQKDTAEVARTASKPQHQKAFSRGIQKGGFPSRPRR